MAPETTFLPNAGSYKPHHSIICILATTNSARVQSSVTDIFCFYELADTLNVKSQTSRLSGYNSYFVFWRSRFQISTLGVAILPGREMSE